MNGGSRSWLQLATIGVLDGTHLGLLRLAAENEVPRHRSALSMSDGTTTRAIQSVLDRLRLTPNDPALRKELITRSYDRLAVVARHLLGPAYISAPGRHVWAAGRGLFPTRYCPRGGHARVGQGVPWTRRTSDAPGLD